MKNQVELVLCIGSINLTNRLGLSDVSVETTSEKSLIFYVKMATGFFLSQRRAVKI